MVQNKEVLLKGIAQNTNKKLLNTMLKNFSTNAQNWHIYNEQYKFDNMELAEAVENRLKELDK